LAWGPRHTRQSAVLAVNASTRPLSGR
jgi:hypothetical protein